MKSPVQKSPGSTDIVSTSFSTTGRPMGVEKKRTEERKPNGKKKQPDEKTQQENETRRRTERERERKKQNNKSRSCPAFLSSTAKDMKGERNVTCSLLVVVVVHLLPRPFEKREEGKEEKR